MMCFGSALEPLRIANRLCGQELFRWPIYTQGNTSVLASNGLPFEPTRQTDDINELHTLVIVAGIGAHNAGSPELFSWLKRLIGQGINLCALSTGSLILAEAGILKHNTCTIHWESCDILAELYPDLEVTGGLYEIDSNIHTCSGGLAGLDMMLHLIAMNHGENLATLVAEQCIHPVMRPSHDKQRQHLTKKQQSLDPRLSKAIDLMLANIENPLANHEICSRIGLSSRQLARLFNTHLGKSPNQHYLELRLERAYFLIKQSTLSITKVAVACGFSNTSHFARAYKQQFNHSPSATRQLAAAPHQN